MQLCVFECIHDQRLSRKATLGGPDERPPPPPEFLGRPTSSAAWIAGPHHHRSDGVERDRPSGEHPVLGTVGIASRDWGSRDGTHGRIDQLFAYLQRIGSPLGNLLGGQHRQREREHDALEQHQHGRFRRVGRSLPIYNRGQRELRIDPGSRLCQRDGRDRLPRLRHAQPRDVHRAGSPNGRDLGHQHLRLERGLGEHHCGDELVDGPSGWEVLLLDRRGRAVRRHPILGQLQRQREQRHDRHWICIPSDHLPGKLPAVLRSRREPTGRST